MSESVDVFLGILLFAFGLFTLLAGLFTAYFGAGRSRAIGFVLTILGLIAILLFAVFTWALVPTLPSPFLDSQRAIVLSLVGVLASAVGAVVALVVFLLSIMKA